MVLKNPDDYEFYGFRVSKRKNKMYDAILRNKKTNKRVHVPFGDPTMENYRDKTGLNAYPHLIHGDAKRRLSFKKRHKKNAQRLYSPAYFSYFYLW